LATERRDACSVLHSRRHYLVSCGIFYANGCLALAELDNSLKLRVKAEYDDLDSLSWRVAAGLSRCGFAEERWCLTSRASA
jgi:hypothetical protein